MRAKGCMFAKGDDYAAPRAGGVRSTVGENAAKVLINICSDTEVVVDSSDDDEDDTDLDDSSRLISESEE
eukprot:2860585-Pleurochrysis_carterae.AAC.1